MGRRTLPPMIRQTILTLWEQKTWNQASLADHLGVSRPFVGKVLREAGIVVGHGKNLPHTKRYKRQQRFTVVSSRSYGHKTGE